MHHHNDLIITAENAHKFAALKSVGGVLIIYAKANLPALTSVGGVLIIYAEANLPALTSVGGVLYIYAKANLPMLTFVGGGLCIRAKANLPALKSVSEELIIRAEANLPALRSAHKRPGRLLATSEYGLWLTDDGQYFAGCQGPFTKAQALAHWDRTDDRALLYTRAIEFFSATTKRNMQCTTTTT